VTANRPKRAQPGALASLRWSTGLQWGALALLAVAAVGTASTVGPTSRPANAAAPPAVIQNSQPFVDPSTGVTLAGQLPASTSAVPTTSSMSTSAGLPAGQGDKSQASALASDGIPATALHAYQAAAERERAVDPSCGLSWPLLAGIGRVESDHGRFAGAVLHTDGVSIPHVIGIPLDGNGTSRILDTDHGRLDGDTVYDRAVGSMQFIPSTWAGYGVDGNGDHVVDPFNIFDAAAAAAHYLCAAGGDLTTLAGQQRAVRAYNDSDAYIALVLRLEAVYAAGVPGLTVPILPNLPGDQGAPPPPRLPGPRPPAVNPGPPLGIAPKLQPVSKPVLKPVLKATSPASKAASTSAAPSGSSCPSPSVTGTATASGTTTATVSGTSTATVSGTSTATASGASATSSASAPGCPTATLSVTASTSASLTGTSTLTGPSTIAGAQTSSSTQSSAPPLGSSPTSA